MYHRNRLTALVWLTLMMAALTASTCAQSIVPAPPASKAENVVDTLHGVPIPDPYRWLENQNSPETRAWIDAQNRYSEEVARSFPDKEGLQKRLAELLKVDRISIPYERNGRYFLRKRAADQDLYVIYMRKSLTGADEVLIDPHPMDPKHNTSVAIEDVSIDGALLAYSIRRGGEDETEIHFLDVDTRKERSDVLPRALNFGLAITADKAGYYYTLHKMDQGSRVYYHAFGSDPTRDSLIFGEGNGPDKIVGMGLSEDGRYLLLTVSYGTSGDKNEVYFADVSKGGPVKTLVNDVQALFTVSIAGDMAYIQTNWQAPNWRLMAADLANPAFKNWTEIVPTGPSTMQSFSLVGGKVYVNYLENVVSKVKVFDATGKPLGELTLPAIGSASGLYGRWDGKEAFYSFTSFHVPQTIYRVALAGGGQTVFARQNVPVDPDKIAVEQVWYSSKDGTRVPMFLVHRKGLKLDGNNPVFLTGYGGFDISETPYFSATAVIWAEHGGIFADPSLRGGGEFGEEWHKAAMYEKKQNTFDDFIAAAEWLIANKYTIPSRLAIEGGSNGGLLVGAVMDQRPDLFKAVVCTYPLLDMLRYHRTLMGPFWVTEYGSADDSAQFRYLRAYSPYHNVEKETSYPAVLFVSGDSDTRVDPMHARKMTALMQATVGSAGPVLLRYDTKAGHAVAPPVSKQIEDYGFQLGFLFWQLGMGGK